MAFWKIYEDDMERKEMNKRRVNIEGDENRDPITGTRGAHPVGTGLGAAAGGAAAGAAGGAVGGPIGAAVGAAVGGIVGGLAGKAIAESIDPTVERAYWEANYPQRPYYDPDVSFEDYEPAYQYGWEARGEHPDRNFEEVEGELAQRWDERRGESELDWEDARRATREAWNRIDEQRDSDFTPPPPKG